MMNPETTATAPAAKKARRPGKKYLIQDVETKEPFFPLDWATKHGINYQTLMNRLNAAFAEDARTTITVLSDHAALQPVARGRGHRVFWIVENTVHSGFEIPAEASMIIDVQEKTFSTDGGLSHNPINWIPGVFLGTREKKQPEAAAAE